MKRPKCSIKGCKNVAHRVYYYGKRKTTTCYGKHPLCDTHIRKKYGYPYSQPKYCKEFPNKKCSVCGWEGPCDRHRKKMGKNGGKYKKGNVVILCPNCHRLLHLSLFVNKIT